MILYTPLDAEQVLNGMDDAVEPPVDIQLGHAIMQVQPINAQQARVVRYISPNALEYMDERVAPGAIIEWGFQYKS